MEACGGNMGCESGCRDADGMSCMQDSTDPGTDGGGDPCGPCMEACGGNMGCESGCRDADGMSCMQDSTDPTAAEVYGCTDDTATNYNQDATVDDGSCVEGQQPPEW